MEFEPNHRVQGDLTGNSQQATGRHTFGRLVIPLGDVNRANAINTGFAMVEDRDSDPNIRRISGPRKPKYGD